MTDHDTHTPSSAAQQVPMTPPETAEIRRVRIALSVLAIVLIGVVAAAGWYAARLSAVAFDASRPVEARAEAARTLTMLRPFDSGAEVTYAILEGRRLFENERWDESRELLYTTYLRHIGNVPLRRELSVVSKAIILRDAGKAHKQHGHEGPMGELGPEDIER